MIGGLAGQSIGIGMGQGGIGIRYGGTIGVGSGIGGIGMGQGGIGIGHGGMIGVGSGIGGIGMGKGVGREIGRAHV